MLKGVLHGEATTFSRPSLLPRQGRHALAARRDGQSIVNTQPQIDRQAADVVPDDLAATLENHRASNRERVIRKHPVPLPGSKAEVFSKHGTQQSKLPRPPAAQKSRPTKKNRQPKKAARRGKDVHAFGSYVLPLTYPSKNRLAPYLKDDESEDLSGYQRWAFLSLDPHMCLTPVQTQLVHREIYCLDLIVRGRTASKKDSGRNTNRPVAKERRKTDRF